jgi:hypothetical protein
MNKIMGIALILSSMYFLLNMVIGEHRGRFTLFEAFEILVHALYYLLAGYAALRLILLSGK